MIRAFATAATLLTSAGVGLVAAGPGALWHPAGADTTATVATTAPANARPSAGGEAHHAPALWDGYLTTVLPEHDADGTFGSGVAGTAVPRWRAAATPGRASRDDARAELDRPGGDGNAEPVEGEAARLVDGEAARLVDDDDAGSGDDPAAEAGDGGDSGSGGDPAAEAGDGGDSGSGGDPAAEAGDEGDTASGDGGGAASKTPAPSAAAYVAPLSDYRLSASFGSEGGLWSHRHTGQDFAATSGTPVRAVADGTIVEAGWAGAYGNRIKVRHADGTQTWYAHLSSFTRTSGTVEAGEVIGRVGSTGNSTGPHLHLEVRINDTPTDPLAWLRGKGVDV